MSERDEPSGVPHHVPREETQGTRLYSVERDVARLERDAKEFRQSVDVRFREGSESFAQLRAAIDRLKDQMDGKVSARHAAVGVEIEEAKKDLRVEIQAVAAAVAEIAPRATPLRLVGWVAAACIALGGPLASYLLSTARTPERAEVRALEDRLRGLEMRVTTIDARLSARGAQP